MKLKLTFVAIFLITFLVGYILSPNIPLEFDAKSQAPVQIQPVTSITTAEIKTQTLVSKQFFDWKDEDERKFKVKLLEPGKGFHGDEIKAKTGEIWLGLFNDGNKYFLRSTKIKVLDAPDEVVDKVGEKTGKDIIVEGKNDPIFLVKNANFLREREVRTLFSAQNSDLDTSLQNGFTSDYYLNGNKYTLKVEGAENSSKLVLETEDKKQVLFFVDAMGDTTWNLSWVGDLDGDGKLDLYADLPVFYNFLERRLFLSSQAENGRLVKQVAMFHTSGC